MQYLYQTDFESNYAFGFDRGIGIPIHAHLCGRGLCLRKRMRKRTHGADGIRTLQ